MALLDAALSAMKSGRERSVKRRMDLADAIAQQAIQKNVIQTQGNVSTEQGGKAVYGTGSVDQWINQAMRVMGVNLDQSRLNALKTIIKRESGGNPRATNLWDSNARRGTPSKGLMQTIPGTFAANALPGYNKDIYDPVSNIIAGYRYATKRYGDLLNVPGVKAMRSGGKYRGY